MMPDYSKLTLKCQITIPKEVRKILNLQAGDYVTFEVDDIKKTVQIKKAKIKIEVEDG